MCHQSPKSPAHWWSINKKRVFKMKIWLSKKCYGTKTSCLSQCAELMRPEISRKRLTAPCYSTRPLKSRVLFIIVWMSEIFTAKLKFSDAYGCRLQSSSKGHHIPDALYLYTVVYFQILILESSHFNLKSI